MKAKKIVGTVLAAAALAAAIAVDCACSYFGDLINLYFRDTVNTSFDMTPADALKDAQAFTQKEAEEGFILLKNDSNALPMKDTKKINVFGNGSYQTLYQGSGSASSWFKQDLNTNVKIKDQDLRVISLNLYKDKEFVVVECHNYFDGELKTIDGALTTTKKNKGYHGLGIKSIKNICNAYGGTYFQEHNGQVFHTTITFNSVE